MTRYMFFPPFFFLFASRPFGGGWGHWGGSGFTEMCMPVERVQPAGEEVRIPFEP